MRYQVSSLRVASLGLLLLSTATLAFEINLARLFSVAQFYHFSFMIVSIALLGFGASGSVLAISPGLARNNPLASLAWFSLGTGLSMLGAYLVTNALPFDSFSIAWDRRQVYILILHYTLLALPFFFSGMATGCLLSAYASRVGRVYSVNLFGSALGCVVALVASNWLGGEGAVLLCSAMAALAALVCTLALVGGEHRRRLALVGSAGLLGVTLLSLAWWLASPPGASWLELRLSPYKGLSYALQYPESRLVYRRWNVFSRVDVVRSRGVHSFPGLSYRYLDPLPAQDGLYVDGDELSPILSPDADLEFSGHLASAAAYILRPGADVLVLEPRGGMDVAAALALGARAVTAVESNPLIVESASRVYTQPGVQVHIESDRSYLRRRAGQFDIVVLSLAASYHPVRSGAYSLAEDYRYTVESFQDAYHHLATDGILVVTRWLQMPPSESLRAFALAVTALEQSGADPSQQIVALRGYNTATLLIKASPFTPQELATIRQFASQRAFDLIYAPGIHPQETNLYNILAEPVYYQAFTSLLNSDPREGFYASYEYDVTPPTDDRPFFGHYFKWSQARQMLAEIGKTWQPFGGAGYFVLLALLILAALLAAVLILVPLVVFHYNKRGKSAERPARVVGSTRTFGPPLVYFASIGLAFLLAEIPLIQRYILYVGQPSYAITTVLFTLLLFSGLGSRFSARIPLRWALGVLVLLLIGLPALLAGVFQATLGLPLGLRLLVGIALLAPLGFLLGIPFPGGIRWLVPASASVEESDAGGVLIPWVWGVNGAASVIAAVAAALLALTWGYRWVLGLSALCYAIAWITVLAVSPPAPAEYPPR